MFLDVTDEVVLEKIASR